LPGYIEIPDQIIWRLSKNPRKGKRMRYLRKAVLIAIVLALITGCGTSYKAKPLPFRVPSSYENSVEVGGATIAAYGYANAQEAKETFGFDIRGAGMLPVQTILIIRAPTL
jgi:hypothetical protein